MNTYAALAEGLLRGGGTPGRARAGQAAVAYCFGLWLLAFCLFELPTWLGGQRGLNVLLFQVACSSVGLVLSLGVLLLVRLTRGVDRRIRLAAIGVASLAALALHSVFDTWSLFTLMPREHMVATRDFGPLGAYGFITLMNGMQLVAIYLLLLAGLALGASLLAVQERERSLAEARAAAQEAQLSALRFQINPHFLFNALNAVTSLVGAGRNADAETVVARLSEFFRASLTSAPGELASLEDELDVAGAYLDIEAARFGPRLQVDIEFEDDVRAALTPHFLLQPLLENAVKYGVAASKRPVVVALRARRESEDLVLEVRDDGEPDGSAALPRGAGVGLRNVAERLTAMFGPRGRLQTEPLSPGFRAEIRLPFMPART